MRLVIMGAPGAGKGTQAARLAARLNVPVVSTGDIFRMHVANQTPLGRAARAHMDEGGYVPDDITNGMVADRLSEPDCADGFLLDGYPRTVAQVNELDAMLRAAEHRLHGVLLLKVDTEELVRRLLARADTEGRADDTEPVIRRRQQVYTNQTAPVVETYRNRGIVRDIDGRGDVEAVQARLRHALIDLAKPSIGAAPALHVPAARGSGWTSP